MAWKLRHPCPDELEAKVVRGQVMDEKTKVVTKTTVDVRYTASNLVEVNVPASRIVRVSVHADLTSPCSCVRYQEGEEIIKKGVKVVVRQGGEDRSQAARAYEMVIR